MESFVELHKELLKEEHDAEIEECSLTKTSLPISEMQHRGICITKLHIVSLKTGLYGRTIIKLGVRGGVDKPLPSNNFSSGDIADLHLKQASNDLAKPELQGVVTSVKDNSMSIALDGEDARGKADDLIHSGQSLLLFKTANEVTYRRLKKGLELLNRHTGSSLPLVEVCFGEKKPTNFNFSRKVINFYNENLNDSQKQAIEFGLSQRELAVIHGPPGTGKTTTIVELITQMVAAGLKILACAPSNVAVDNILEKLSNVKVTKEGSAGAVPSALKILRLGHPARMLTPHLHRLSLDARVAKSEAASIVQDVRKDLDQLHAKFRKKHNKQERIQFREERTSLMKELKEREKKAVKEILSSAEVVLATNAGAHSGGPLKHLPDGHFDVVIIDECGQALEASCWIPMLQAPKCVLAGDHLQLPPTIKSHIAASKGLAKSLLERMVSLHGDAVVRMLDVQYRMNTHIMNWSSENMYQSKLVAHNSVQKHLLSDLQGVTETEDTMTPLLFIDTAGCDMSELQTVDNESIGNPSEANIVANHVTSLVEAGMEVGDIAVVSPYNMQVDLLRKLLREQYPNLEIRSIDGFQGREKEAVVLSLVRSNDKGDVGFLSDDRRMNVAVTRARRHLALICDSLTVGRHKFLKTLIDHMHKYGEVRSAHEFTVDETIEFDASSFIKSKIREALKKQTNNTQSDKQEALRKENYEKAREKFHRILTNFAGNMKGDVRVHEFPTKLKPYERRAIHEICEEMGLKHGSIGEGEERQIIVSTIANRNEEAKVENATEDKLTSTNATEGIIDGDDTSREKMMTKDSKNDHITKEVAAADNKCGENQQHAEAVQVAPTNLGHCNICGRDLPSSNISLHRVHCGRLQAMKEKLSSAKQDQAKTKPKKPPKQKKTKAKNIKEKADNIKDDDDELLEEAIRRNRLCSSVDCERPLLAVGQMCALCKKSYCLEHHVPERHSCGAAAHSAARRQIIRDGVLYSGSGVPSKNLPPAKHAHLQRKLGGKLKEMQAKRKPAADNKK